MSLRTKAILVLFEESHCQCSEYAIYRRFSKSTFEYKCLDCNIHVKKTVKKSKVVKIVKEELTDFSRFPWEGWESANCVAYSGWNPFSNWWEKV